MMFAISMDYTVFLLSSATRWLHRLLPDVHFGHA